MLDQHLDTLTATGHNLGRFDTALNTWGRPSGRLLRFPEVRTIDERPTLPTLHQEIAAHYRRRYLTCPCCGGRGLIVGELTGRRGIPDEWEVSCWAGCGERWWVRKEQG
jgi:hypothetical protein